MNLVALAQICGAAASLVGLLATAVLGFFSWKMRAELAEVKLYLKDWVDDKFVRKEEFDRYWRVRREDRPSTRAVKPS